MLNRRTNKVQLKERVERLHRAVLEGQFKLVKILVEGGVDVNSYLDDKTTLMAVLIGWKYFFARRHEIISIIRYLFSNGADPYLTNSRDQNSFDILENSDGHELRVQFFICVHQRACCKKKHFPNMTGKEVSSIKLELEAIQLSPTFCNKRKRQGMKRIDNKDKMAE